MTTTLQRDPDEYNGFKSFDNDRFVNAIVYFCKHGVFKTKLNKLLFYLDFKHFKGYTISITGSTYVHVPFGPEPDDYELYFPILVRQGLVDIEELIYQDRDCIDERYWAKKEPNLNVFNETEIEILYFIENYFKSYNTTGLSQFSHGEKGYIDTEIGDLISYKYADYLKI
jgi:hypothetical protein